MTLLAGFLGSGKSTLLKHILECKRAEEDGDDGEKFRCAVIVNDMAVRFCIYIFDFSSVCTLSWFMCDRQCCI